MSFTIGERIAINNTWARPTSEGKIPEVLCDVTAVAKHHVLAQIISITNGAVLAVKEDGTHELSTAEKLPEGAQALKIGDVTALAFCDIHAANKIEARREELAGLSRDVVKARLKLDEAGLDSVIRAKLLTPRPDGTFHPGSLESVQTYFYNYDKEHRKFGDDAKEFNRLGSQLHPEIFGKAW